MGQKDVFLSAHFVSQRYGTNTARLEKNGGRKPLQLHDLCRRTPVLGQVKCPSTNLDRGRPASSQLLSLQPLAFRDNPKYRHRLSPDGRRGRSYPPSAIRFVDRTCVLHTHLRTVVLSLRCRPRRKLCLSFAPSLATGCFPPFRIARRMTSFSDRDRHRLKPTTGRFSLAPDSLNREPVKFSKNSPCAQQYV